MIKNILLIFLLSHSIISFSQEPTLDWAFAIQNITGNSDEWGKDIVLDSKENIYLIGSMENGNVDIDPGVGASILTAPSHAVILAKFDSSGILKWGFNIPGSFNNVGNGIAMSPNEEFIYATGYFESDSDFDPSANDATLNIVSAGQSKIFLAKYDTLGNYQWALGIGGDKNCVANDIVVSPTGSVYITGYVDRPSVGGIDFDPSGSTAILTPVGETDIFIAKYSSSGNYEWAFLVGNNGQDAGNTIAIDDTGENITIGGYVGYLDAGNNSIDFDPSGAVANYSVADNGYDAYIANYDSLGNFNWLVELESGDEEQVNSLILDNNNNIYAAGSFQDGESIDFDPSGGSTILTAENKDDIFFAKYTPSGALVWTKSPTITENSNALSIDYDSSKNIIYSSGYYRDDIDFNNDAIFEHSTVNSRREIFIMSMDTAGNYLCSIDLKDVNENQDDEANALEIVNGVLYTTGFIKGDIDFDPSANNQLATANRLDLYLGKYNFDSCNTVIIALPISLLEFEANVRNESVSVDWITATEINNDFFEIERSLDGVNFEKIGTQNGAGNSSVQLSYNFMDNSPYKGLSYYRVKQVDFNGSVSYSKLDAVYLDPIKIISVYPNPAIDHVTILIASSIDQQVTCLVYNPRGQIIINYNEEIKNGLTYLNLNTSKLAPGNYIFKVLTKSSVHVEKEFIITN